LSPRKSAAVISGKHKFLVDTKASTVTVNKWQKAIEANGVPGISWIGNIPGNGFNDPRHKSGKRDTIIFAPNTTDFAHQIELMYYFHGFNEFGNNHDFQNRISPAIQQMSKEGRNFVIVIPELPWATRTETPKGRQRSAWTGNDSFNFFHTQTVQTIKSNMSDKVNITFISITAHSAGGGAVKSAALKGLDIVAPKKITFSDADYADYVQTTWNSYAAKTPDIEINILTGTKGTPFKKAKAFIAARTTIELQKIYFTKLPGKSHSQIGDTAIQFVNPREEERKNAQLKRDIATTKEPITDEDFDKEAEKATDKSLDKRDRNPKQPESRVPSGLNADVPPSKRDKKSNTRQAKKSVIREAVPFPDL